jgi:hypothetical protein
MVAQDIPGYIFERSLGCDNSLDKSDRREDANDSYEGDLGPVGKIC